MVNYIDFENGTCPIIFISSHDGNWYLKDVKELCDRYYRDKRVNKILRSIIDILRSKYHLSPYYIISNLGRTQIDMNRPKKYGAKTKLTRSIWLLFHKKIRELIKDCIKHFGYCMVFDLHGYFRSSDTIQLGYGLDDDEIVENKCEKSSLHSLSKAFKITTEDLMYGRNSLCNLIEKNGLECIPNSTHRENLKLYFNGGFITRYYAQKYKNKAVGIIQIEFPKKMRAIKNISKTSRIVAKSIIQFMKKIKKKQRKTRKTIYKRKNKKKKTRKH